MLYYNISYHIRLNIYIYIILLCYIILYYIIFLLYIYIKLYYIISYFIILNYLILYYIYYLLYVNVYNITPQVPNRLSRMVVPDLVFDWAPAHAAEENQKVGPITIQPWQMGDWDITHKKDQHWSFCHLQWEDSS